MLFFCYYSDVQKVWNNRDEEILPRTVGPYILNTQSVRCVKSLLSDEVFIIPIIILINQSIIDSINLQGISISKFRFTFEKEIVTVQKFA